MMLISKETLIGAAALGAGAVAAKVVQKKVVPMILPTASENVKNLITLGVGILTPTVVKGPVGAGLGAGMIAASVAGLVDPYLVKAGIAGMGEVLMGNDSYDDGNGTLMGAADTFVSQNSDYVSQGTEMDY